jgi:hypothetical protein
MKKLDYLLNPRKCIACDSEIPWDKRVNKYCNQSCCASFNNKGKPRVFTEETKLQISNSVKQSYIDGKKVYGGNTKWYSYKDIKVQGTYELRTCKILDKWKLDNRIYSWEYTNDRIPYIGLDNKPHQYLLDFKVFNSDRSYYYIEVKGYKTELDEIKWKALSSLHSYEVWYISDIKSKEKELI